MTRPRTPLSRLLLTSLVMLCASACGGSRDPGATGPGGSGAGGIDPGSTNKGPSTATTSSSALTSSSSASTQTPGIEINPACYGVRDCYPVDLLFVIDNSGTMGEEQENLARNFKGLIEQLTKLTDADGRPVKPSINVMITTTDTGHELCERNNPENYTPAKGDAIATACSDRLTDFTGRTKNPISIPQACTNTCVGNNFLPMGQPFIHFGPDGKDSNVPMDRIIDAINCIGPQGINGCGYESPLDAMERALLPTAKHNQGDRPFLRDGAYLAVALVTDEADCSVKSPMGYKYFRSSDKDYWEIDPLISEPEVSSAVCWNGGVECTGEMNGVYQECHSVDRNVLTPVSHYIDRLRGFVSQDKEVVMLGILGVPEVTKHSDKPPFEPLEGGVKTLKYRHWEPQDILPGATGDRDTPAGKEWEFGIGPGCTRLGSGQAVPPVRIKEVCESLNRVDDKGKPLVRCCIESICDDDFSAAMKCLSGLIQVIEPPK